MDELVQRIALRIGGLEQHHGIGFRAVCRGKRIALRRIAHREPLACRRFLRDLRRNPGIQHRLRHFPVQLVVRFGGNAGQDVGG